VADRNPHALENVAELVLENPRVGIDAAVHPLAKLELRVGKPLLVILRRHFKSLLGVFLKIEGATTTCIGTISTIASNSNGTLTLMNRLGGSKVPIF
jgi:hypothetical protein